MQVRNVEGVATHNGPESCGGVGNGVGEALTGERAGRVLNREIEQLWGADAVEVGGRRHPRGRQREAQRNPTRSETPCAFGSTATGNRESPGSPAAMSVAGRVGKSKD
jgi:hypothetical protein